MNVREKVEPGKTCGNRGNAWISVNSWANGGKPVKIRELEYFGELARLGTGGSVGEHGEHVSEDLRTACMSAMRGDIWNRRKCWERVGKSGRVCGTGRTSGELGTGRLGTAVYMAAYLTTAFQNLPYRTTAQIERQLGSTEHWRKS